MNMTTSIRPACHGDIDALARINAEVQDLHFARRPDHFKPSHVDELARWFERLLQDASVKLWIAEQSGCAVGYVGVRVRESAENPFCWHRKWWDIDQIGVVAAHRRSGIGRVLVNAVVAAARAHDITDLELNSWAFNREAHQAFERLGFAPRAIRFEMQITSEG